MPVTTEQIAEWENLATHSESHFSIELAEALAEAIPALIADLREARANAAHWKANHDNIVRKLQLLTQREDLPVDRIPAYQHVLELEAKLAEANLIKASIIEDRRAWMHAAYNLLDAIGCPLPPGAAAADVGAHGAAEAAVMRRDAKRYRFLRDTENQLHEDDICVSDSTFATYFEEELDAAVDTMIQRNAAIAAHETP